MFIVKTVLRMKTCLKNAKDTWSDVLLKNAGENVDVTCSVEIVSYKGG